MLVFTGESSYESLFDSSVAKEFSPHADNRNNTSFKETKIVNYRVRLEGGNSELEGRVEIFYNNE